MRVCLVVLPLLVSCGTPAAKSPTTPVTAIATTPTTPTPAAPPSCADVGVLLRGAIESTDKAAGPQREAAIANACLKDQWAPAVMLCIASSPQPDDCLDKLTEPQTTTLTDALAAWDQTYGDSGEDDVEGGVEGGADDDMKNPFGKEVYVDCDVAVHDVASYAPAVTLTGEDRTFVSTLRNAAINVQCFEWDNTVRDCLQKAPGADDMAACLAMLEPGQRTALTVSLTEIDALMTKTIALRKKPAAIDCKKVVAAHYGDATWKAKLDSVKGADRKRMIEESRKKMTVACTADKWTPTLRACFVAGGDACGLGTTTWDFPASGVIVPTGLAECDKYAAVLQSCKTMDKTTHDLLVDAFSQMTITIAKLPVDVRPMVAESCTMSLEGIAATCKP